MKRALKILGLIIGAWALLALIVGLVSDGPAESAAAPAVSAPAKPDLELLESEGEIGPYSTTITGKIRNNRGRDYSYVQVTFDLYSKAGNKVGTALGNVNGLEAGETWEFKAVGMARGEKFRLAKISGW